ncbi:uncharacterized protein LOC128246441 [Mya arenaria]|uniref:uncharacterized protein LOC128246441 n=1 Tax=Mya arenaria TaxID=6604 RepID=UPI0022DFF759|nr:uncharacterized protein LOC128246441 [Mya arenaria]
MPSPVQITAPVAYGIKDPILRIIGKGNSSNSCTPSSASVDAFTVPVDSIQPYVTRLHTPFRVTFTPGTRIKSKSRVTDQSKYAVFNYKPLKRKDHPELLKRIRAPEATLTTLQNLSPWLSITKSDYRDPRVEREFTDDEEELVPRSGLFRRSFTEGDIDLSKLSTPKLLSRGSLVRQVPTVDITRLNDIPSYEEGNTEPLKLTRAKPLSREQSFTRSDSVQSFSLSSRPSKSGPRSTSSVLTTTSEKKVTIADAEDSKEESETNEEMKASPMIKVAYTNGHSVPKVDISTPTNESAVNYYSGYLPPELSNEIAAKLKIGLKNTDKAGNDRHKAYAAPLELHKPLIGDRSNYIRDSYPVKPQIMQPEIDQMRLEGRKRLLQSYGRVPAHFSALKGRGTNHQPRQKGARLEEAVRQQHRLNAEGVNTHAQISRKVGKSSVELFQLQRERTYHLQKLAKEMLKE